MRCKNCGDMMHHFLLAEGGKNFYRCQTGLTSFEKDNRGRIVGRKSNINPCGTIQDAQGKVLPIGTSLAYISEGRVELYKVDREWR